MTCEHMFLGKCPYCPAPSKSQDELQRLAYATFKKWFPDGDFTVQILVGEEDFEHDILPRWKMRVWAPGVQNEGANPSSRKKYGLIGTRRAIRDELRRRSDEDYPPSAWLVCELGEYPWAMDDDGAAGPGTLTYEAELERRHRGSVE